MRSRYLRVGLASLMVGSAAMAAVLVACSDDDNGVATPAADSGTDTSSPGDAGTSDSTTPNKEPAKLQIVNAATDLGPTNPGGLLRFCYGLAPNVFAPLPPLPDQGAPGSPLPPGVPIGIGGAVAATSADLSSIAITPYIVSGVSLAQRGVVRGDAGTTGMSCGEIFGPGKYAEAGGPLVENVDYWALETIPAGTFVSEKSFVLVVTGCPSDTTLDVADRAKCGPDFTYTGNPGRGNLKITRYEVDRATAIDATKLGTQFIHASAAGDLALTGVGGAKPGYVTGGDAGVFKPVSAGGAAVAVNGSTALVQVEGVDVATASFTVNTAVAPLAIPLPAIQGISFLAGLPDGGGYRNGAAFTFIAVGDPDEPLEVGDQPNPKTFHYLGLPNNPTIDIYK